jgi:hypothetical protein
VTRGKIPLSFFFIWMGIRLLSLAGWGGTASPRQNLQHIV